MGGSQPKQFMLLEGEPLLLRSLRPFLAHPYVEIVVVALPPGYADQPPDWLCDLGDELVVVAGGAERGDSVYRALQVVPDWIDVVLIHDAARPLVDRKVIDGVMEAAAAGRGAVAAVPVTDTIKEVDESGRIVATPERGRLWRAQTPQGFPRQQILDVYRRAVAEGVQATDDAALVERYGGVVHVLEGSVANIKVTGQADLEVARALMQQGA